MMERLLTEWLANSTYPLVTAVALGLLVSISPCPLSTNITAMAFIGKDMVNRRQVFFNGLFYTLGTIVSYTLLAAIIYLGADQFEISGVFQRYSLKIIGPLLVVIGLVLAGIIRIPFPGLTRLTKQIENKARKNYSDAFFLGVLLALAFCPHTGALYFGMLIPLTISSSAALVLPLAFALASAIPVVIFAYLMAYALNSVGVLFNRIKSIETLFRKIVSVVFILAGIYLIFKVYFASGNPVSS